MLILARDLGACFLLRFHIWFLLPATLGVTSSPPMEGVVGISPMYVHYQKEQKNNSYFGFRNRPFIWKLTLQLCAFFFKIFFWFRGTKHENCCNCTCKCRGCGRFTPKIFLLVRKISTPHKTRKYKKLKKKIMFDYITTSRGGFGSSVEQLLQIMRWQKKQLRKMREKGEKKNAIRAMWRCNLIQALLVWRTKLSKVGRMYRC